MEKKEKIIQVRGDGDGHFFTQTTSIHSTHWLEKKKMDFRDGGKASPCHQLFRDGQSM